VVDHTSGFVLAFLGAGAHVDDLAARPQVRRMPSTTGEALVFWRADRALFDELHARGACRWCRHAWRVELERGSARGLYTYQHVTENWIAGPYARLCVPESPRRVDELPAVVRETALGFDGRFAELAALQPAEHWPCRAHRDIWLASDFETTRSFDTGEIVAPDDDA